MSNDRIIELESLPGRLAICKIKHQLSLPYWASTAQFFSATRSADEFSIVVDEAVVPPNVESHKGWRAIRVKGKVDFSETGILARLTAPLAKAKISIFAISTFDTDYLLVQEANLAAALKLLDH